MKDLESKVKSYISDNELFPIDSHLLVAVSGGVDSVVLLSVLHNLGYKCSAAHCNFNLRGEESIHDENYVTTYVTSFGLPLYKASFNTQSFAKEKHLSIEMAARQLRYEWFEQIRQQASCDYIVVAHHLNDSIETFFLNLVRGTGIKGLTGIAPKNGFVVRPFLSCTREEIESYASIHKINYCIDSTNADIHYKRNAIRHAIIPQLKDLNPSFDNTMLQNLNHIANIYILLSNLINSHSNELIISTDNVIRIDINKLLKLPYYGVILAEILLKYGFNANQISRIEASLMGISGRQFLSSTYRLVKDRDYLLLEPITPKDNQEYTIDYGVTNIEQPFCLNLSYSSYTGQPIVKDSSIATLDMQKLSFPLHLRRWRCGDSFYPFGMHGRKKLSDFFTDRKLSLIDKDKVFVLCDSVGNIVWVVGMRIDNRYAVNTNTTQLLRIELK